MLPTPQNTAALLVTYHPDAGVVARLFALADQFGQVVVVDNHSEAASVDALRTAASQRDNIVLLENRENVGVAAALNRGCRRAEDGQAQWLAMFDQDSVPDPDLLARLAAECGAEPTGNRIGLVGVNFRTPGGRTFIADGTGLADARAVITSGTLLKLDAWRDVGPFREDFFIDEVDHEYALRARRRGWLVKICRRVLMEHAFGSPKRHTIAGWHPTLSHHSALRRYYMVRNRLLLAKAHLGFDPLFVLRQLSRSVGESGSVLLFEPDKLAKLRAMSLGFADGLRGRGGRAAWHAP